MVSTSVAFLHINNKLSDIEITKTVSSTIASKRIGSLGIHLAKEVKAPWLKTVNK